MCSVGGTSGSSLGAWRKLTAGSLSPGGRCSWLRGILPALFAIVAGMLVGAVQRGDNVVSPLVLVGIVFVPMQVLPVIHRAIGANLGSRLASWLYDRLTVACVRPAGMGHLESAKLTSDLTMARDFDLAITGPPMAISMDFIASGLVEMVAGLAAAVVLFGYAWWAPVVLAGAWLATHWLLRESGVWRDRNTDEVRAASRDADYAYRLAVEPARRQGATAVRPGGLGCRPLSLTEAATFRAAVGGDAAARAAGALERTAGAWLPISWCFRRSRSRPSTGAVALDRVVTYATAALMSSTIAFGGLSWALDGAAAPVAAVLRLDEAMDRPGRWIRGPRHSPRQLLRPSPDPLPEGERAQVGRPMACRRVRSVFATFGLATPTRVSLCSTDLT